MPPPPELAAHPLQPPVSRYRFFPGWTMLAMAAAAQFASAPGQSYSVAAFKDPMRGGLGISETDFSLAYAFATLMSGLCLPFVGRLVDRHGARRALPLIALLLGGGCLWMSTAASLGGLYTGFTMIRCLGQGALTLVSVWLVGEWFQRRRGLATAVAGLGGSLSVMSIPLLNGLLIAQFGWQAAWVVLAVGVWVLLVVPAMVLVRNRPEDLGLHPDNIAPEQVEVTKAGATDDEAEPTAAMFIPAEDSWTVRQVLRDPTFYKLLAVPATSGMIATGLVFHQVALLGSRGVAAGWALGLITLQAAVGTAGAFAAGWLTDRVPSRYLLAAAMGFLGAAVTTVLLLPLPALAVVYAVLLGLHGSILRSTGTVVWINYYGRANQGAVRGVALAVMVLAAALGPLPLALAIDRFGSYDAALLAFIAVPALAAALVWTAHPPRRPER